MLTPREPSIKISRTLESIIVYSRTIQLFSHSILSPCSHFGKVAQPLIFRLAFTVKWIQAIYLRPLSVIFLTCLRHHLLPHGPDRLKSSVEAVTYFLSMRPDHLARECLLQRTLYRRSSGPLGSSIIPPWSKSQSNHPLDSQGLG